MIRLTVDGETIEIDPSLVSFESVEEEIRGEEIIPHVIEPSFGIDRIIYTVLDHSFYADDVDGETRAVLRFKSAVAPIEVAVLPLMDRKELSDPAKAILQELRRRGMRVDYDTSGSIGRRYRRNDEIGTPFAVTVDYDTLEQGTVTIRDRDTMQQVKVPRWQVADKLDRIAWRPPQVPGCRGSGCTWEEGVRGEACRNGWKKAKMEQWNSDAKGD